MLTEIVISAIVGVLIFLILCLVGIWIFEKEEALKFGIAGILILLTVISVNQLMFTARINQIYEKSTEIDSKIEYLNEGIKKEIKGLKDVVESSIKDILDVLSPLGWSRLFGAEKK